MVTKWHPRPSRLLTRCFKLPLPPSPLKFFWIFLSWFFFFFFYYITRPSNSLLIFRSSLARYLLPALLKDELHKYYEKKFNLRNHRSIPLNFRETQNKNKKKKNYSGSTSSIWWLSLKIALRFVLDETSSSFSFSLPLPPAKKNILPTLCAGRDSPR